MADKVLEACGGSVAGKKIAVLGVTFKPDTDDMRDAPSLVIIPKLQEAGASIVACDPQGEHEGSNLLTGVHWNNDPYTAAIKADVIVLITEWNVFRGLDLTRLADCMHTPAFVDLRNVYSCDEMVEAGIDYYPVGKTGSIPNPKLAEKSKLRSV